MAFDYGSVDLGLKNPFKTEGFAGMIKGLIQLVPGFLLVFGALGIVEKDRMNGQIMLLAGLVIIIVGLKSIGQGILSAVRFYVGRNHPTSLARNYSPSAADIADFEANWTAYSDTTLEGMLAGRKNPTFIEPQGMIARLLYSFMPKLLFMPFPLRNLYHQIAGAWVNTLLVLVLWVLSALVCLGGFAGSTGTLLFPFSTFILTASLVFTWYRPQWFLNRDAESHISSLGQKDLVKPIVLGVAVPFLCGLVLEGLFKFTGLTVEMVAEFNASFPLLNPAVCIPLVLACAIGVSVATVFRTLPRISEANPLTEVSELRENWQNTVHPRDIFINLDNDIMARRRYQETPNRVYRQLNPQLQEQVNGKGTFQGELIQEVQPRVMIQGSPDKSAFVWQLGLLGAASLASVAATVLISSLAGTIIDIFALMQAGEGLSKAGTGAEPVGATLGNLVSWGLQSIAAGMVLAGASHWLLNLNRAMNAEIRFESLLIFFRCQGTFTESKISTGMSINDSMRSENIQVRSSISPYMMVSRIISTTYAGTGMRNLEHPRHVLEMHAAPDVLQSVRQDLDVFLHSRETLAGINNHQDLANAAMIQQLNQAVRQGSLPEHAKAAELEHEASFRIRDESEQ